jgi:hypothetical protein
LPDEAHWRATCGPTLPCCWLVTISIC